MHTDWGNVSPEKPEPNGPAASSNPPGKQPRKRRIWIIAIVGLLAVVAVLVGIKGGQIKVMINAGKSFAIPPETVTSAKVEAAQWESSRSAVATLVAMHSVTVSSELPGLVRKIGFDSGAYVRRGDVMVQLDTSTEEAQLAAVRADSELAQANVERQRRLRKSDFTSAADLDAAESRAKQATANAGTLVATIAKKTIRAPFAGRVAIRQVELGQVVGSGTPIASLQSIDPVYADFWLPQQAIADVTPGMRSRLRTDVFGKRTWDGAVTVVNSEVDVS
ncbi:MAG: efflux RND transporter periplasmic adaptor subunit, partial [Myxococcales bacterium]